jgi:hypothetical protein
MISRKTLYGVSLATLLLALTSVQVGLNRTVSGLNVTAARSHDPKILHEKHGKNVTSTNWSGYAVTGAKGSVSDVKASWVVPPIATTCPSTNQYAAFWVGIDGYSSNTVEQIGTDSDCQNGNPVYYAWYEFYPHFSYNINSVAIHPGDQISAEVSANSKGTFTVTLTDETTGKSFTTTAKMNNAERSSAEWIAEAPYSGGVLPLANFGTVQFGSDYTPLAPNASTATIKVGNTAVTGPIASFANNVSINMVDGTGALKDQTSVLSQDGTSFSIAWIKAGP